MLWLLYTVYSVSNNAMVGDNIFLIADEYVVVDGVYAGVGVGFCGAATVSVPLPISEVNVPPTNSIAGWPLIE